MYNTIVISSGHGLKVRGAKGYIDEVDEARKVVDRVAYYLRQLGAVVDVFHDNTSTTQNQNLSTIVAYHNKNKTRQLDISVHFNASKTTTAPMGVEVLYYDHKALAEKISKSISEASGLKNRGAKMRQDLYFLRMTNKPAILIEVCFVDSQTDVELYRKHFDNICKAIAETLTGKKLQQEKPQVTKPIQKEGEFELYNPTSPTIKQATINVLKDMEANVNLASTWREKLEKGQLTTSDAIGLLYVALERNYIKKK